MNERAAVVSELRERLGEYPSPLAAPADGREESRDGRISRGIRGSDFSDAAGKFGEGLAKFVDDTVKLRGGRVKLGGGLVKPREALAELGEGLGEFRKVLAKFCGGLEEWGEAIVKLGGGLVRIGEEGDVKRGARRIAGLLLLLAVVVLVVLGLSASYSPSGWIQIDSLGLVAIGLMVRRARKVAFGGIVLFVGVVAVRIAWIGSGRGTLHTLPGDSSSRSMGVDGAWWTGEGERRVRATLDFAAARKFGPVFLAGLSNGGAGASLLAGRLGNRLAGLILISGVSAEGSTYGLPTLVVHGAQDPVMSRTTAEAFADRTGSTYAEFLGGHFVMLVKREAVEEAMSQ